MLSGGLEVKIASGYVESDFVLQKSTCWQVIRNFKKFNVPIYYLPATP
jgi:hypothetical protein